MVDNQGGCCDNDVHEHFKCLEETVFKKAFIIVRDDSSLLTYNCAAGLINNTLNVEFTEECDKLHINTARKCNVLVNGKEFDIDTGMTFIDV